jgi:hypothetical protein
MNWLSVRSNGRPGWPYSSPAHGVPPTHGWARFVLRMAVGFGLPIALLCILAGTR